MILFSAASQVDNMDKQKFEEEENLDGGHLRRLQQRGTSGDFLKEWRQFEGGTWVSSDPLEWGTDVKVNSFLAIAW